jgi:hypothetical protein
MKHQSQTPVEAGILRYGGSTMRNDMSAAVFKIREKAERQKLHDVMKEAYPEVLLNFGDGLMDEFILLIIKRFAPNSCKDDTDPDDDVPCKIPRKKTTGKAAESEGGNVCIEAYLERIARSLTKHGGREWKDKRKKEVNVKVGITDMCVIITKNTNNHQAEFKIAAKDMKIPFDLLHAVGFLSIAQSRGSVEGTLCAGRAVRK